MAYVNGTLSNSHYDLSGGILDITAAPVTVGGKGFALKAAEIEVKNSTIKLKELQTKKNELGIGDPGIVPDENGKIPLSAQNISIKNAGTNADVSNGTSNMIDGATGSNSYACTSNEMEEEVQNGTSVYFQIDLGDVFDADDHVIYSTVTKEAYSYGILSKEKLAAPDAQYAETSAGKEFVAGKIKGRYLRIYMRGSAKELAAENPGHGGCHICEVEVYGTKEGSGEIQPQENTYKVTFHTNGAEKIAGLHVKEGETFEGWFTNVNLTQRYTVDTPVTEDVHLFAKWTAQTDPDFAQVKKNPETEIAKAAAMGKGQYSDESWNAFQAAYAGLKTVSQPIQKQKLNTPKIKSITSTAKGVNIKWMPVKMASSYLVKRNGKAIGTLGKTSFLDKTPKGNAVNTYQVIAVGDGTQYTDSNAGKISTKKLPPKVLFKSAKEKDKKQVVLKWKKVKGASGYVILRSDKRNGTYTIRKIVKNRDTYTDRKIAGKKPFYKVVVKRGKLYGPASKIKQAKR